MISLLSRLDPYPCPCPCPCSMIDFIRPVCLVQPIDRPPFDD